MVQYIHGMDNTPTYSSWRSMKTRVLNKNSVDWLRYGGRGITMDPEWYLFENFFRDMGIRPKGTTLDRKDNNGNYNKENCRWATKKEQQQNRRGVKLDDIDLLIIRNLGALKINQYHIADVFGVRQDHVSRILSRQRCDWGV
jgi:hypothetical protein